jgi:hypothetical protein
MWNVVVKALPLLSTMLLFYPAFHVARYGASLHRLSKLAKLDESEQEIAATAQLRLQELRDSWTPLHGTCLILGTGLAALANLIELLMAYMDLG